MAFAFIFSDVGVGEWFVLLAVVLVVVGPKRLPEAARTMGKWYSRMRRAAESFKRQILDMESEFTNAASGCEQQVANAFTVEEVGSAGNKES
jgi:Tat protein translocase TatB subunit